MRRRELASGLIASTAANVAFPQNSGTTSGAPPNFARTAAEIAAGVTPSNYAYPHGPLRYGATGNGKSDDQSSFNQMCKVNGYHFIPDALPTGPGFYLISSKIQTSAFVTLVGSTRQNTWIGASGFADYLLEIGGKPSGPNPNVGAIERLKLTATNKNTGILHMNQRSHMWRLNDLLFQSSPCPAIVNDNCWDANYTNIDIMGCGSPDQPPHLGAAVIVKNGSNNIYFRGLRIEQCPSGCIYVGPGCAPVHIVTGKMDMGYMGAQRQPAVTVEGMGLNSGLLLMDDYVVTGVTNQYVFRISGGLKLGAVFLSGATNMPAIIEDVREWGHVNSTTFPGNPSAMVYGPTIPTLDLGNANFSRASPFINQETRAAVISRIPKFRYVQTLQVTANGNKSANTTEIGTTLNASHVPGLINGLYNGCYLVHNPTGTLAQVNNPGSRRRILQSYSSGAMLIAGNWGCTLDSDWSIEYQAGHYTPNFAAQNIQLDQGMDVFAILQTGVVISGEPTYIPSSASGNFNGCTSFKISAPKLQHGTDLAGYYLVDEVTGEPYLIAYGTSGAGVACVPYDRIRTLNAAHTYSIVAGYDPNIRRSGVDIEWTFAGRRYIALASALRELGFDSANIPIWGFATSEVPAYLAYDPITNSYSADASQSGDFTLTATDHRPITLNAPTNLSTGDRLLFVIRNISGSALGTLTWNAIFKMAVWVNPAPSHCRSVEFRYDGRWLVEIGRTPDDVPV